MKSSVWLRALGLCAALTAPAVLHAQGAVQAASTATGPTLQAVFTPWDDVEGVLVETIARARERVLVQAYLLTSKQISAALIAARRRGLDVQVLLDAGQLEKVPSSTAALLAAAGVAVWVETKYQNAHNKVMLIDPGHPDAAVVTGSYNFTWTAQHRNAENVLIVRADRRLAARYLENWERHRADALPYAK
jgi:phosphatidylserine/phosphatidylglycerophosphate/cardiolipin synthase-like enzyme